MIHLVNLPSLQQWQDYCTFNVEDNFLLHGNIPESNTAITRSTSKSNDETTTLM